MEEINTGAAVSEAEQAQAEIPQNPNVRDYLIGEKAREEERQAKYKKIERRDPMLVFVAAALAGDNSAAGPISKAINAVMIAEETIKELVARGHLD